MICMKATHLLGSVLLLALLGCGPAPPRDSLGSDVLQLVPWGTSLESAEQAMKQHGFACSAVSYTSPEQMKTASIVDYNFSDSLWKTVSFTNGLRIPVTNVGCLRCVKTNCTVTLYLANGTTARLSASGSLR
jgi:hypothetical protein